MADDAIPLRPLAAALDDPPIAAQGAARPEADPPQDEAPPPPPPPRGGKPDRPKGEIWEGCPVTPLGVNGGFSYFLDVHGQMRAIGKAERMTVMQLFGRQMPQLCWHFPKWVKDQDTGDMTRKKDAFDCDGVAMAMYRAASERGLFDPEGAVRGVGAWADDDGQLIYHTGDGLLMGTAESGPCTHQGRIYPAYPPIAAPAPPDRHPDPVPEIMDVLETWAWARPEIDATIALGMIGAQMLGGALDWRPVFWLTGGKGTGKSQFQTLIKHLHGDKGLFQSNDATKSGITSRLGHSSLPVALDELEPGDEGSSKERDIIVLARVAASGGQWFRGSSDQKGASGNVYSTFLFSSILIPGAMKSQDLSRLIVLSLQALPENTPPLTLRAETWRKRGAALKRLLIDRWPTWAQRLEMWREAFAAEGLGGRNGDNWATVMAMADMARQAALPDASTLDGWTRRVAGLVKAGTEEIGSDADSMMVHLLSQRFDIYRRGEQHTIAQWLMVAAQLPGAPSGLMGSDTPADREDSAKLANAKLASAGLRVIGAQGEARLFIANTQIQGLKDLFRASEWANGVWSQSAIRVKGAAISDSVRTLAGIRTRGVEIPFTSIPGLAYLPAVRVPAAPMPAASDLEDFA